MKDTACENCPFKKMGFEQCPNYIETLWHQKDESQPVIIKDCAPKRSLLMVQELYNRTFALQQQINQSETEMGQMRGAITKLYEVIQYVEDQRQVDQSAKTKYIRHLASMKTDGAIE
ncbi:MAG: hypothetical protein V4509_01880 [Patescibacteria group bacterium]